MDTDETRITITARSASKGSLSSFFIRVSSVSIRGWIALTSHLQHAGAELAAVVVARRHLQRQQQRLPRLHRVEDPVHPQPRRRVTHVRLFLVARLDLAAQLLQLG